MKNLTPAHMRCGIAQCPSVHQLEDGRLLIVGKAHGLVALDLGINVDATEAAIIIDRALLAEVLK